jgi:SAM-dependent methyltransferase
MNNKDYRRQTKVISERAKIWAESKSEILAPSGYIYPTSEAVSEPKELQQDPQKRVREQDYIHDAFKSPRGVTLDFGCGVGANFEVILKTFDERSFLIAIDPDRTRLQSAFNKARSLSENIACLRGGIDLLQDVGSNEKTIKFDDILCCQVIGHVPSTALSHIIETLVGSLAKGGSLALLYPFTTTHDTDYFHLINLKKAPDEDGFRTSLSQVQYDGQARNADANCLPVRAYATPMDVETQIGDYVETAKSLTSILDGLLVKGSISWTTRPYSFHVCDQKTGHPLIGDVITVINRAD